MKMRVLTALYWLMGLMIGLGAFGHGFLGSSRFARRSPLSPFRPTFAR
jgi:hypothetical protein